MEQVTVDALLDIRTVADVIALVKQLEQNGCGWRWVGDRDTNAAQITASRVPIGGVIERLNNAFDAVLELYALGSPAPAPESPRQAADAWFGIPQGHLHHLDDQGRRQMADHVTLILADAGVGKNRPTVIFWDRGTGQTAPNIPGTILSLNAGNKLRKLYLTGTYGQGGSQALGFCEYTIILSRRHPSLLGDEPDHVAFTIVRRNDSDLSMKMAVWEYLVNADNEVLELPVSDRFPAGTYVAHVAYHGDRVFESVSHTGVRALNYHLFDPILPYRLTDERNPNLKNRVVAGSLSRLTKSQNVEHNDTFEAVSDELGPFRIRYWVFRPKPPQNEAGDEGAEKETSYLKGYLDDPRSAQTVVLTLNGQRQHSEDKSFLRDSTGLSFLVDSLLVQVECDDMSPLCKRELFAATREGARAGRALNQIKDLIAQVLGDDPELQRINQTRRTEQVVQEDEKQAAEIRSILQSLITDGLKTGELSPAGPKTVSPPRPEPREPLAPLPVNDPPTMLASPRNVPLTPPPGHRLAIRLECDAPDDYFSRPSGGGTVRAEVQELSGVNILGRSDLRGGRFVLRAQLAPDLPPMASGAILVTVTRPGTTPLHAEIPIIVDMPQEPKPNNPDKEKGRSVRRQARGQFDVVPVHPSHPAWRSEWNDGFVGEATRTPDKVYLFVNVEYPTFKKETLRRRTDHERKAFQTRYIAAMAYYLYRDTIDQKEEALPESYDMQRLYRRAADTILLAAGNLSA